MGKVAYFKRGAVDIMRLGQQDDSTPGYNEVLIRHTAIGVSAADVESLRFTKAEGEMICGVEACGVIEKIGAGVSGFEKGQRVAYATAEGGAYSESRCIDIKHVLAIPDAIDDKTIAALLGKGLTVHALIRRAFLAGEGMAVLIHNASFGLEQVLSSWCKMLGALVIGTVSTDEEAQIAAQCCHHVVKRTDGVWAKEVLSITNNLGVNAVYDGVGKETFLESLDCLMTAGIILLYGQMSGTISSIDPSLFMRKSLFFTTPVMRDYKANRMELILSADAVFEMLIGKNLPVNIAAQFSLDSAGEAHRLLVSGKANGAIILTP